MPDTDPELIDLNLIAKLNIPIPAGNLADILMGRGYQVEISGQNLSGRQDETIYLYDRNQGALTVRVDDLNVLEKATEEFQEVLDDIGVTPDQIQFLNLSVEELVWSGSDTTEVFASLSPGFELSEKFTHEPKPAALSFISHSSIRNQSDYFDLRIESYVQNTSYFYVNLVYRKPDFEQLTPMCHELEDEVDTILSEIEAAAR